MASTAVPDRAHLDQLEEMEDRLVQNQISAVGFVKPGKLRLLDVQWPCCGSSTSAPATSTTGATWPASRPSTSPVGCFSTTSGGCIFASNYDGSIESYMDDFIDKVAFGLNAAFSNGVGYPKTKWLVTDGAKDEQAFKNYLRAHQIPTQIWYSAYGDLTAVNIANNAAIRAGLSADDDRCRSRGVGGRL